MKEKNKEGRKKRRKDEGTKTIQQADVKH